jgi:hypothetical protein
VIVAQIATDEVKDKISSGNGRSAGGNERARVLLQASRKEIAKASAEARWS